jgi:hypothetical protein
VQKETLLGRNLDWIPGGRLEETGLLAGVFPKKGRRFVSAKAATEKAPRNTAAWVMLARARGSKHDDAGALDAARQGLVWSPRDPDLLRSQATALAGLGGGEHALARAALAAFDRFRAPDEAAALRIACARSSARCQRERELGHVHDMQPAR